MATSATTPAKRGERNLPGAFLIAVAVAIWGSALYLALIIVGFGTCDAEDGLPEPGSPQDSWCHGPAEHILLWPSLLALVGAIVLIIRWMTHRAHLRVAVPAMLAIPAIQILAFLAFGAPSDTATP